MAWAAIDDTMPHHPKVMALNDREFRAWICALAWSQRYKTNGQIPEHALDGIPRADKKTARRLTEIGLWHESPDGDGWVIHDWETYNPAAVTRRDRDAERKRRARGHVNGTETTRTETPNDA